MPIQHQHITARGIRFHVAEEGSGPPLILLHGWPEFWATWEPVMERLADRFSFLGIGIQPPDITWGLMVAQGRNYLSQAWWLAFFPGLAIMFATLSANLLSNWLRIVTDPEQRWRLEIPRKADD